MNRRSGRHFRYILVPFLAAVMFIAAISISDSYNSSSFPDFGGIEAGNISSGTVTLTDAAAAALRTPSASDLLAVSAEPGVSGTEVGEASVEVVDPAVETPAETPAAETTGSSARTETEKTTKKTAGANGKRENAPHVSSPDYLSKYYIVVFLRSQNVIVYGKGEDGGYSEPVKCFVCSSGKKGHSTRLGLYKIIRRYRWRLLVGDVYGQYATGFSESYLFHSVPYLEENDPSSLDMAEYDKLGSPASKGCIRLCVRDAKWIFENCPDGTQINIVDDADETEGEPVILRMEGKQYSGWDPSDPDPASPYNG